MHLMKYFSFKSGKSLCHSFVLIINLFFLIGAITYTNLYNVLDFPAGTMPVRKVTQSDIDSMKDYKIHGLWEKQIKKVSRLT